MVHVYDHVYAGSGSFVFGTQEVTVTQSTFNVNAVAAVDCDADGWPDVVYVRIMGTRSCSMRFGLLAIYRCNSQGTVVSLPSSLCVRAGMVTLPQWAGTVTWAQAGLVALRGSRARPP